MNKKILVAYFTKGGDSEEYANIITETLTADGLVVESCNLAHNIPDVADFILAYSSEAPPFVKYATSIFLFIVTTR